MSGTPEWLDDKGKIIEHKYLPCSLREIFITLGDGQKWSKVCK